jgi:hypothetical protein
LLDELQRELSDGHILKSVIVETVAHRGGASDDVLFRRIGEPQHYAIVHLTWSGRPEIDPRWPSVIFEGTFEELLAYDKEHLELERSSE